MAGRPKREPQGVYRRREAQSGASGRSGWGFEDDLNPFGFGSGTGGSLIGPGHPGFGNAGRPTRNPGGHFSGVLPGARFDPIGPFVGQGRGVGGGRGRGMGGGPNPDHLPPPYGPSEFDFMYQ